MLFHQFNWFCVLIIHLYNKLYNINYQSIVNFITVLYSVCYLTIIINFILFNSILQVCLLSYLFLNNCSIISSILQSQYSPYYKVMIFFVAILLLSSCYEFMCFSIIIRNLKSLSNVASFLNKVLCLMRVFRSVSGRQVTLFIVIVFACLLTCTDLEVQKKLFITAQSSSFPEQASLSISWIIYPNFCIGHSTCSSVQLTVNVELILTLMLLWLPKTP